MPTGDGWTSRLLVGLAQHLDANSIGDWDPTGTYTADQVGILIRAVPSTPDTVITLAPYVNATAERGLGDLTTGVQLRFRGTTDPRVCEDLADEAFDLLDSSGFQVWGTPPADIVIADVYRASYTSLGQDSNGRWEASHNYFVEAMRPTTNRTD